MKLLKTNDMHKTLLFVYGTLCSGRGNHHLLQNARLVGPARTAQRMVLRSSGPHGIPFVGRDQAISLIEGELYEVDAPTLGQTDALEGCAHGQPTHPLGYRREEVLIEAETAAGLSLHPAYMYLSDRTDLPIVDSGRAADFAAESADDVWYFAYGRNLDVDALRRREVRFTRRERATLANHVREFTKRASNPEQGGYATVRPLRDSRVNGALYRIPAAGMALLDRAEGVKTGHYRRTFVTVARADGSLVEAVTYVAQPAMMTAGLHLSAAYWGAILRGSMDLMTLEEVGEGTHFPADGVRREAGALGWSGRSAEGLAQDEKRAVGRPFSVAEYYACSDGGDFWSGIAPGRHARDGGGFPCAWKVRMDGERAWLYKDSDLSDRIGWIFERPHPVLTGEYFTKYWGMQEGSGLLFVRASVRVPGGYAGGDEVMFWVEQVHP
ncbi:MAG: hypothetical protein RJA19_1516 [Bacteroidota bacterium]